MRRAPAFQFHARTAAVLVAAVCARSREAGGSTRAAPQLSSRRLPANCLLGAPTSPPMACGHRPVERLLSLGALQPQVGPVGLQANSPPTVQQPPRSAAPSDAPVRFPTAPTALPAGPIAGREMKSRSVSLRPQTSHLPGGAVALACPGPSQGP